MKIATKGSLQFPRILSIALVLLDMLGQLCRIFRTLNYKGDQVPAPPTMMATKGFELRGTLDVITSRSGRTVFKCSDVKIIGTSFSLAPTTGRRHALEIDVWATPLQHFDRSAVLHRLLVHQRHQRFGSVRRRLDFEEP